MAVGSKSFPQEVSAHTDISKLKTGSDRAPYVAFGISALGQVGIAYTLLLVSLWTSMATNRFWLVFCGVVLLLLSVASGHSRRDLGLQGAPKEGWLRIVLIGLMSAAAIVALALVVGEKLPVNSNWPPPRDLWQYAIWAMVQQFILQSFFYVRLESLLGARTAVFAAALLFSGAHLPSPVLTAGTLLAGLFFCEMFRRYRSIFPLGIVHAALGLSLAETVPDRWLHHMRVGIGYLHFYVH